MYALSREQVAKIEADVECARITISHLADDLIDHICCEVENEMWNGKSFDQAYQVVKQQTGITILQKIQENTHYLIDKNYRIMKMTMKITGNVSLVLLALGTVMKLFQWTGASIALVLGFVLLCLVFFPAAIYANYKETKANASKLLHISILIGGMLFMAGVLFKVMHWPAAGLLLLAGWVFILFIFLPVLLFVKIKQSDSRREKLIFAIGIFGLIIFELSTMFKFFHWPGAAVLMIVGSITLVSIFLPMYTYSNFKVVGKITEQYIFIVTGTLFFILLSILIAINTSKDITGIFVQDIKSSTSISKYLEKKNQIQYSNLENLTGSGINTNNETVLAIKNNSESFYSLIEIIKVELLVASEKVDKQVAMGLTQNVSEIGSKTSFGEVTNLMLGQNCNGYAYKIKQKLNDIEAIIKASDFNVKDLKSSTLELLATPDLNINNKTYRWEDYTFQNKTVIGTLAVLADLETKVRMIEACLLFEASKLSNN
jgi:hypothetical protein